MSERIVQKGWIASDIQIKAWYMQTFFTVSLHTRVYNSSKHEKINTILYRELLAIGWNSSKCRLKLFPDITNIYIHIKFSSNCLIFVAI